MFRADRASSKPAGKRDNFSKPQREAAFAYNAREVDMLREKRYDWREALGSPSSAGGGARIYYICEHCRFVSERKEYFEVDHLVSCQQRGNANRERLETLSWLQGELDQPLDRQDLGRLMLLNLNSQVLCHGCNQGKKSRGARPDEIPAGCGFAYRKPGEDRNPDHRDGLPPLAGYVHPRYRRG